MNSADGILDGLADELLSVLSDDIRHIKQTLERLDALRAAVIRRDEEGLKCLLDEVANEQGSYTLVEQRRAVIRKQMADVLGCGIEEMNLSKLCGQLTGERRDLVAQARQELQGMCEKLRKEHTATNILLKECSRFNNLLLRGILGNGRETVTYNSRGDASWELQRGMVSIRL